MQPDVLPFGHEQEVVPSSINFKERKKACQKLWAGSQGALSRILCLLKGRDCSHETFPFPYHSSHNSATYHPFLSKRVQRTLREIPSQAHPVRFLGSLVLGEHL